jgi:hypothetical protein
MLLWTQNQTKREVSSNKKQGLYLGVRIYAGRQCHILSDFNFLYGGNHLYLGLLYSWILVVSLEKAKRESINEDILIDPGIVH